MWTFFLKIERLPERKEKKRNADEVVCGGGSD